MSTEAEEIGSALVNLVVTSRALGHSSIMVTARDYLAPHAVKRTPAQQFVLDAILKDPHDLISDDEIGGYIAARALPALPAS